MKSRARERAPRQRRSEPRGSLLFNQVGVLLVLILMALTAYVVIGQPPWAIDPLRSAASGILSGVGASLVLLAAWAVWIVWLLSRGPGEALRKWRYAVGSALLVLGASSALSYFNVSFPLIGESPLGGAFGERARGADGALGALGTVVLLTFGGWLVMPVVFNYLALGAGRGAVAAGRGARAAGRGTRAAGSAAGRGIGNMRRPRTVSEELDDFFAANDSAQPSPGKRSVGAEYYDAAARATEPYGGTRAPVGATRPPAGSSGLAYLDPASSRSVAARPVAPRPAPPPPPSMARSDAPSVPTNLKPNFWPGLVPGEEAETEERGGAASAVLEREPREFEREFEEEEESPADEPLDAAQILGAAVAEAVAAAQSDPVEEEPYEEAALEDGLPVSAPFAPEDALTDNGFYDVRQAVEAPEGEFSANGVHENGAAAVAGVQPAAAPPLAPEGLAPAPAPFPLPPMGLLAPGVAASAISQEHLETAALIEETLAQHGVEVSVSEIRPGPSVTMFGLVPGWNRKAMSARARALAAQEEREAQAEVRNRVKVDSILAREKDLALALAAPTLRIQAPVPGEPLVGVEMPNKSSSMVTMRTVMESREYDATLAGGGLPVALGLATAGDPVVVDLLKMPHLLIAGATGSGKSVCINTIISSIICHQDPAKVRMLLVDPKRVELTPYNGIPHLVTPVVVDPDKVVRLLRGAIQEMMRRYKLLEEAGARNIVSYNRSPRATERMPYFVICIDELADLMMTASFDVEQSLCRLAQLGRATGIHLIVATQRPSVDVLTGLIKANFPSRIAFAVASQVDSRTILDSVGAERLIGRGDMLFLSSDSPKPRRVQGVYISEDETAALGEHWRQLPVRADLPAVPLEDMAREAETSEAAAEGPDLDESDSLYDRALQLAATNRQLSTSLLQRRLRIGYPRAARLMDQLEDDGVVASSGEPGKPREVIAIPGEPSGLPERASDLDDE